MSALVNFMLYEAAWFASILGAANGRPFLGVMVSLLVVSWHLRVSTHRGRELKLVFMTGVIGAAWESILTHQQWVYYESSDPESVPIWILTLWLAFATTLNQSLSWLKKHLWLSALLGMLGGPLAWLGGMHLGGLTLSDPVMSLVIIGCGWAVIMPLLFILAKRYEFDATTQPRGER
jgi:hypothetical protein